jgi:hypothetical protein
MTPQEQAIYRWEGGLIIQIDRLAGVQKRLTKQLVTGRLPSEVAGAYADDVPHAVASAWQAARAYSRDARDDHGPFNFVVSLLRYGEP